MATERQIAANRANALLSTGPRTPEGKAIAARNGFRHSSLAGNVLLRTECAESFNNFVDEFYAEHNPQTPTERALVNNMAVSRWKSLRLSNLEAAQIDFEFSRQTDPSLNKLGNAARTGIAYRDACLNSGTLSLINRTEARLQHQFDSALNQLRRLRGPRPEPKVNNDRTAPLAADNSPHEANFESHNFEQNQ